MGKWYTRPLTKRILILSETVLSVFLIGAIIVLGVFSGKYSDADYLRMINRGYPESKAFIDDFYEYTHGVLSQIRIDEMYIKDGEFDKDQIVDILSYAEGYNPSAFRQSDEEIYQEMYQESDTKALKEGIIYDEQSEAVYDKKIPAIEYRIGDIVENNKFSDFSSVIVCQREDDTYQYYTTQDFISKFVSSDKYVLKSDLKEDNNFIKGHLEKFKRLPDGNIDISVCDKADTIIYVDCWNFPREIMNDIKTIYGESLLDVVNNYPEFNGKLMEIYSEFDFAISTIRKDYDDYKSFKKNYDGDNTNYKYVYTKADGSINTNDDNIKNSKNIEKIYSVCKNEPEYKYVNITPYLSDFDTNMDLKASEWKEMLATSTRDDSCRFLSYVNTEFKIQDSFYDANNDYERIRLYTISSVVLGILSTIALIVLTVLITIGAGRKYEDSELHLVAFDNVKTEIAAAIIIVPSLIILYGILKFIIEPYNLAGDMIAVILIIFFVMIMLTGYLSLVRRIKAGNLWRGSLLKIFYEFIQKTWNNRGVVFKSLVFAGIVAVINLIASRSTGFFNYQIYRFKIDIIVNIVFVLVVIAYAIDIAKVKKGLKEIADGNLDYKIESESIKGPLKETAETINNIGIGMKTAVDEKISSERLKTDLITNVSHDIKTPLTSIINYVDILKREDIKDEKIKGYINILDEKSKRLKTLTEDVLEASKASSGNIKLYMQKLDIVELLRQTAGEFEEKMTANDLSLVCNFPDESAVIYADGRRMWRIYENTLNNAAKYSMKGTRVYLDVKLKDKKVYVVIKNISAYQLNITADQLTERFVRGDVSRTTEGTGLGLSISRSLTELQGGNFEVYLDGDLFKVTTSFPIYDEKTNEKDEG